MLDSVGLPMDLLMRSPRRPAVDARRVWSELVERSRGRHGHFEPASVDSLPSPAKRYFLHAIEPGARLRSAVELELRGTIKLGGRWLPFEAEHLLVPGKGFVTMAKIGRAPFRFRGFEQYAESVGLTRWRLLGVPVVRREGRDMSRSAIGRLALEAVLAPASLLSEQGARWDAQQGSSRVKLRARIDELPVVIELVVGEDGHLREASTLRWSNFGGGPYRGLRFGMFAEQERRFGEFTIPSKIRAGWWFGTPWFREGEILRATIERAFFR